MTNNKLPEIGKKYRWDVYAEEAKDIRQFMGFSSKGSLIMEDLIYGGIDMFDQATFDSDFIELDEKYAEGYTSLGMPPRYPKRMDMDRLYPAKNLNNKYHEKRNRK